MSRKQKNILYFLIISSIIATLIVLKVAKDKEKRNLLIQNVFDEMVINHCEGLRKAEYMEVINYDRYVGEMTLNYKNLPNNISKAYCRAKFWDDSYGIGVGEAVCFVYVIYNEERKDTAYIRFEYNSELNKLYVIGSENMPIEEREQYRDYLLDKVLIGNWPENTNSRYSRADLGEFEIVDEMIPVEYCGMAYYDMIENEPLSDEVKENEDFRVRYVTWVDNEELCCIQQTLDFVYGEESAENNMTLYLWNKRVQESYGMDVGGTRFFVQRKADGTECKLSDIVYINDDFINWIKESGQAVGNLQKISPSREEGSRNTQEMLKKCPESDMRAVLEQCEFYIEPGYLHVKFPYWSYEKGNLGWEENGNKLWTGWLTMRTNDIEEFLKVGKW